MLEQVVTCSTQTNVYRPMLPATGVCKAAIKRTTGLAATCIQFFFFTFLGYSIICLIILISFEIYTYSYRSNKLPALFQSGSVKERIISGDTLHHKRLLNLQHPNLCINLCMTKSPVPIVELVSCT